MVAKIKYKSPLSEETLQMAKDELREDEQSREQALAHVAEWIEQNPRIDECRTDANFLLRYLRAKKFSIPMAEEAIERYLLLRQTYKFAFGKLDVLNPTIDYLVTAGYIFVAPGRDRLGRRVIIYRPGVFNPHKHLNTDMCRIHMMTYETLMEDEEGQVKGYVHFADGAGVTFPYLTLFTPLEAVRIVKNGERTLPMRHKEVHGINVHPTVKYALDFGMSLISEKIRKRVKIYTSIEEAHNFIDVKMLPKEYGGEMPMAKMIELWKQELLAAQPTLLAHDNMKVRLEMFSEGARVGSVAALKGACSMHKDKDILVGSFRKLQVD